MSEHRIMPKDTFRGAMFFSWMAGAATVATVLGIDGGATWGAVISGVGALLFTVAMVAVDWSVRPEQR